MNVFNRFLIFFLFLSGCAMQSKSLKLVDNVDINKFMGDWYVIAHIPAFIEKNAYNAV